MHAYVPAMLGKYVLLRDSSNICVDFWGAHCDKVHNVRLYAQHAAFRYRSAVLQNPRWFFCHSQMGKRAPAKIFAHLTPSLVREIRLVNRQGCKDMKISGYDRMLSKGQMKNEIKCSQCYSVKQRQRFKHNNVIYSLHQSLKKSTCVSTFEATVFKYVFPWRGPLNAAHWQVLHIVLLIVSCVPDTFSSFSSSLYYYCMRVSKQSAQDDGRVQVGRWMSLLSALVPLRKMLIFGPIVCPRRHSATSVLPNTGFQSYVGPGL